MFIDDQTYTTKYGKTHRRVLLRNSYRLQGKVRHDVIANLSKASSEEIDAIKWALKNKQKLSNLDQQDTHIKLKQGLSVGSTWLLMQVAKRIGLTKALGQTRQGLLSLWMVLASVIGSRSRLSSVRLAQKHAACDILNLKAFNEDDLYQALDWLDNQQQTIEQKLFKSRYGNKKPTLYLYDVTSSYLEGEHNAYGQYGYNRDGKKGKKQIVIGLLTGEEGWPISCEVFEGNTQDPKTVYSQVSKLAERFGVKQVTFVGDRGMVKRVQVEALDEQGFYYITAITKAQIQTLIREGTFQMELFEETVHEVVDGSIRYILRRNPMRAEEIGMQRENKLGYLRAFVEGQNEYLRGHARAKVEVALRKAMDKIKQLKVDGWVQITAKDRELCLEVDEEARVQLSKLDGCYVIKTNVAASELGTVEVHERYKDLKEVEWAFRSLKSPLLNLRGVFVRTAAHTRAHVFVAMLSYMLVYDLRRAWVELDITVEEGIDELSSVCAMEVFRDNQLLCQSIPKPRSSCLELLKCAGVVLPDVFPASGEKVVTRKPLPPSRKKVANN